MLNDIGCFCTLPKWRKEFKAEWKKAAKMSIILPLNDSYQLDPIHFVCTCPQFIISRFLVCKHLVQSFHTVNPVFFLQVSCNHVPPFWSHPTLIPINSSIEYTEPVVLIPEHIDLEGSDSDDNVVDTAEGGEGQHTTFHEQMASHIKLLQDFCDGLKYQTLEKDGAGMFRLERNCLSCEHWLKSTHTSAHTTWESSMANTMFYRSHPTHAEQGT
ncbi:hypothetical protein BDQ12DRAFT_701128 [Crucibulum laeve]|uniref:SWIM-type domain-containing protein n=1 Tax=Crucibulum laeve TaxID=68775 RepID=A0A5C3LI54_9AGAR|nr:hypothetical protein BDQ12DRAFT_701128 [Crucibulum laeve]